MITFGPDKSPENAVAYLRDVQKQMNYAGTRTANNMALKVQRFTLETLLPGKFTLRSKGAPWQRPGTKFGFNIKFASKENPQAVIGSQADWLEKQEMGGTKTGNGHQVAIPTTFWKPKASLMERYKKPRALLNLIDQVAATSEALNDANKHGDARSRKRAGTKFRRAQTKAAKFLSAFGLFGIFRAVIDGKDGIFARTGKGKFPIKMLFDFEQSVAIKPLLEFEPTGIKIVNDNINADFALEFAKAMSSAK